MAYPTPKHVTARPIMLTIKDMVFINQALLSSDLALLRRVTTQRETALRGGGTNRLPYMASTQNSIAGKPAPDNRKTDMHTSSFFTGSLCGLPFFMDVRHGLDYVLLIYAETI